MRLFGLFPAVSSRTSVWAWGIAIFFIGLGSRLILPRYVPTWHSVSCEAVNIAISLATTGKYADAYGMGVGPTAHCAPLHPLLLSFLIRIFGTGTGGVLAMAVAGSAASALAFALLPALAAASGLPVVCGTLSGMIGAVVPFNFFPQTSGTFDAPFTAASFVAVCIIVCRIRERRRFGARDGMVLGIATGLCSLLNPVVLPVICSWLLLWIAEERRSLRTVLICCGACAGCVVATLAPWALRNYEVLGSLIWTRSNFWLEVHVSNNDWLTADEQLNVGMREFAFVHPYRGAAERAEVKRLGEVAYMRAKRKQAVAWILTHKRRFLELTAERFRLFWFPRMGRVVQTVLEASLTILGLSGLVLLFRSRQTSAWIFGAVALVFPDVYYLVQVTPRYRFPLEPFLFLLAGYCCFCVFGFINRSWAKPVSLKSGRGAERRLQWIADSIQGQGRGISGANMAFARR